MDNRFYVVEGSPLGREFIEASVMDRSKVMQDGGHHVVASCDDADDAKMIADALNAAQE